MKLENQVCTIKQALELRMLGVEQNSAFYYFPTGFGDETAWHLEYVKENSIFKVAGIQKGANYASAFTVAELFEVLPCDTHIHFYEDHWRCNTPSSFGDMVGMTAAQAMAEQLISLIKTGDLTPEEANHRLTQ